MLSENDPLYKAIWRDDGEAIERAAQGGADLDQQVFVGGAPGGRQVTWPLIMCAALVRNHASVDALIQGGATIDTRSSGGETTLMALCKESIDGDQLVMLRKLIEAGGDVNATDRDGRTVLDYAAATASLLTSRKGRYLKLDRDVILEMIDVLAQAGATTERRSSLLAIQSAREGSRSDPGSRRETP